MALLNGLQRTAGNAAVARMLEPRPPERVLARYEAGEHAQMGSDRVVEINGASMTEGEMIALGDFYATAEDLLAAPKSELEQLIVLIRRDRDAMLGVPGATPVNTKEWEDALRRNPGEESPYLGLLQDNASHFAGPAAGEENRSYFAVNHRKALKAAHAAATGAKTVPEEATALNGFACHFLTDAFSAGHLFVKHEMLDRVEEAWNAINESLGPDLENTFTRGVAERVLADAKAAELLATRELWELTGGWQDVTQESFSKLLMLATRTQSTEFYNLILNLVHDRLDESIKDPERAIEVTNERNKRWTLSGDKSLGFSSETLAISKEAVAESFRNLELAAKTTDETEDEAMIWKVWEHTPTPTAQGAGNMEAVTVEMLDLRGEATIGAFAAKTIENLEVAVAEMEANNVMRKKLGPGEPARPPQGSEPLSPVDRKF